MAQLTLSEKNTLAENSIFRGRVFQGLFSKANYHRGLTTPTNLKAQKQQNYADKFLIGGANSIDIFAVSRFWLSNFNVEHNATQTINSVPNTPIGFDQETLQPYDDGILNTAALDTIYDSLAGVIDGDENAPVV